MYPGEDKDWSEYQPQYQFSRRIETRLTTRNAGRTRAYTFSTASATGEYDRIVRRRRPPPAAGDEPSDGLAELRWISDSPPCGASSKTSSATAAAVGREREQQRQQRDDDTDDAGGDRTIGRRESDVESTDDEEPTESDTDEKSGGGLFGRGKGSSGGDEDDFDDLFYRIEELEEELESKESTLGTVQDSQQQVADQVEEMNDTVRQLLGVYDMLTDDVNPFTGAGEERNGFGVFGEDKATTDGGSESMAGLRAEAGSSGREETVSFDDLKGELSRTRRPSPTAPTRPAVRRSRSTRTRATTTPASKCRRPRASTTPVRSRVRTPMERT